MDIPGCLLDPVGWEPEVAEHIAPGRAALDRLSLGEPWLRGAPGRARGRTARKTTRSQPGEEHGIRNHLHPVFVFPCGHEPRNRKISGMNLQREAMLDV